MKVDEGLALASYTRGIGQDGWIEASAELGVIVYRETEKIFLMFWIPDNFEPRDVICQSDSKNIVTHISPGVVCEVEIPCDGAPMASKISIIFSATTLATPPDIRLLGAVLVGIKAS